MAPPQEPKPLSAYVGDDVAKNITTISGEEGAKHLAASLEAANKGDEATRRREEQEYERATVQHLKHIPKEQEQAVIDAATALEKGTKSYNGMQPTAGKSMHDLLEGVDTKNQAEASKSWSNYTARTNNIIQEAYQNHGLPTGSTAQSDKNANLVDNDKTAAVEKPVEKSAPVDVSKFNIKDSKTYTMWANADEATAYISNLVDKNPLLLKDTPKGQELENNAIKNGTLIDKSKDAAKPETAGKTPTAPAAKDPATPIVNDSALTKEQQMIAQLLLNQAPAIREQINGYTGNVVGQTAKAQDDLIKQHAPELKQALLDQVKAAYAERDAQAATKSGAAQAADNGKSIVLTAGVKMDANIADALDKVTAHAPKTFINQLMTTEVGERQAHAAGKLDEEARLKSGGIPIEKMLAQNIRMELMAATSQHLDVTKLKEAIGTLTGLKGEDLDKAIANNQLEDNIKKTLDAAIDKGIKPLGTPGQANGPVRQH